MDNLTHTLFGVTLARAAFVRRGRGTTAAIVLASNAPDIDIVAAAGGALDYLAWHRGPTHGPLGIVGLGLLGATIVWLVERTKRRPPPTDPAPFATLVAVSLAGVLCHVLMDLPTSYGTRLFSPFDWHWYAWDVMPIVDVYLLTVLIAGLVLGQRQPEARRRQAVVALGIMLINYGVRAVAHRQAVHAATAGLAPVLPALCPDAVRPAVLDWWPRDEPTTRRERATRRCLLEVAAIPTFFSPLRWHAVARTSDAYQTLAVDLVESIVEPPPDANPTSQAESIHAGWRRARRHSDQWTRAALHASTGRLGRVFLDFARFPATSSVLEADGRATVRWTDLRFAPDGGPPSMSDRRAAFFSAVVVVARSGDIESERLGP